MRINSVPTAEEHVNAKWGDLQADYQRRSDLIPNLVATVKGYAQQEKSVLSNRYVHWTQYRIAGGWSITGVGRIQAVVMDFGNVRLVGMTEADLQDM